MHAGIGRTRKMKEIEGDWTWRSPMKYVAKLSLESMGDAVKGVAEKNNKY